MSIWDTNTRIFPDVPQATLEELEDKPILIEDYKMAPYEGEERVYLKVYDLKEGKSCSIMSGAILLLKKFASLTREQFEKMRDLKEPTKFIRSPTKSGKMMWGLE